MNKPHIFKNYSVNIQHKYEKVKKKIEEYLKTTQLIFNWERWKTTIKEIAYLKTTQLIFNT